MDCTVNNAEMYNSKQQLTKDPQYLGETTERIITQLRAKVDTYYIKLYLFYNI